MELVLLGVPHDAPRAARTEDRLCDPIPHVSLVLVVAVLFLFLCLFLFVFREDERCADERTIVKGPTPCPDGGIASQTRRVRGNGGTISPTFLSGTSCVSGY